MLLLCGIVGGGGWWKAYRSYSTDLVGGEEEAEGNELLLSFLM